MKASLFDRISRAFKREDVLHPLDGQIAKRWIKQRLAAVFPELRNNPKALEAAYHELNLEPRPGIGAGEPETIFQMQLPRDP